jgi:uracil-DNA glycosylase family 4
LADEWRRYLQQQIELGGSEVVLSAAVKARGPGSATRPSWRKGAPPIPGPGLAIESPEHALLGDDLVSLTTIDEVAERIRNTHCCGLCPGRTNAVPGEGNPNAKLFLVGEGPGATEDAQGRPFVGQAGNLLNGILDAIEIPRDSVYITNIVKCRPPQNRKPLPDEIAACMPYLHRQLELIRPKVILALGSTAGEAMLGVRRSLGELRGKVHTYNGIPLVVTYHPAALLRNPNWKKPTWDDVRIARQLLDR